MKNIFALLLFISPLSVNYTPLVSHDKNNVTTKISTSRKQIPLTTAKKASNKGKLFKNISDKQVQSKKTGVLKKNFESFARKEVTIHLQSSSYFTYSISYKRWIQSSDGSLTLRTEKQIVEKHSKSKAITASFFNLNDLTMHMEAAGQKDTKFTFTNGSVMKTLVKNHFNNDENPSFNLKVGGTLVDPKTSCNYINSKNAKSTEIGTFKIESAASWWAKNSIVMEFVITILFIAIAILGFTPVCMKFLKGISAVPTDTPSIEESDAPSSEESSESGHTSEDNSPSITTETSSDGESIVLGSESEDLAPKAEAPVKKRVSWGGSTVNTYNKTEPIIAKEVTTKSVSNDPQQIVHADVHEDSTNAKTDSDKKLSNSGSNELSHITPASLETINENSGLITAEETSHIHTGNDIVSKLASGEIIKKVRYGDLRNERGVTEDEMYDNWHSERENKLEIDPNKPEKSNVSEIQRKYSQKLFEDFYDESDHDGHMKGPVFGGEDDPISYDQAELGDRITVRAPGLDPSIENGNQSVSNSKIKNENSIGSRKYTWFWEDILIHNVNMEYGDAEVNFTRPIGTQEKNVVLLNLPNESNKLLFDAAVKTKEAIISREKDPSEDDFTAKYPELVKPYEKNTDAFEQSMRKMDAEARMISDDYTTMTKEDAFKEIKGPYRENSIAFMEGKKTVQVYRYMNRISEDAIYFRKTVRLMQREAALGHNAAVSHYSDLLKAFLRRDPSDPVE